jgi:hypothetical protein
MLREKNDKAKIKIKNDHVIVNGQKIKDNVQPPSPEDVMYMDRDTKIAIQNIEFVTTRVINISNSKFQLYAVSIYTPEQCRIAYKAIASIPQVASKTHLISAYHLSTDEMGWQDDGDYGLGRFLLRTMQDKQLDDTICFLTREYGGVHIGQKRFEVIESLVNMMIVNAAAQPNKKGKMPFRISAPNIDKLSPSEQDLWKIPRKTVQAVRKNEVETENLAGPGQHISENDDQPTDDEHNTEEDAGTEQSEDSSKHNQGEEEGKQQSETSDRQRYQEEEEHSDMDTTVTDQKINAMTIGKPPVVKWIPKEPQTKPHQNDIQSASEYAEQHIQALIMSEQQAKLEEATGNNQEKKEQERQPKSSGGKDDNKD